MTMTRPALRRGVRFTHDRTRGAHVLLFPEGVLMPNPTAVAVLGLCDGESTVDDIVAALRTRYAGVRADEVQGVLDRLVERRVLEWT